MKGLLLISSGFDSAVAGYIMKQQKIDVIAVHFGKENSSQEKWTEQILKKIDIKKLYIVELAPALKEFLEKAQERFACVFCKRMMLRIAEKIAEKENCDFLITGDSPGQVASQTLHNMTVIDSAVKIKVMRPLLGKDKKDIMDIARKIGTYDISKLSTICCAFAPKSPATKSTLKQLEAEEASIDIEKIIKERLKTMKIKNL
ncbi:7-cyano-7-deazaguanine synthase [Candidatus Woesearchaeota archaeon]|nr:7-cyano-7-deazaguanine synthase [Candidatus Woesearchaeota archaeon]